MSAVAESVAIPATRLMADALRMLAIDAVEAASSGHPGMPLGMAEIAVALWDRHLKHNPHNPAWPDRDRFVLSSGHGSMLLYGLLHLTGYDLPIEEHKRLRQLRSKTPGHPEVGVRAFWRQYVGLEGGVVGIDTFGESGSAAALFEHFDLTARAVVAEARRVAQLARQTRTGCIRGMHGMHGMHGTFRSDLQEFAMAFIALRQLLDHAAEHGYGVPAFNVNNMEQIHAIMQAAEATSSPVILQASAGARKYAGEAYLRHLVLAALEAHPDLPLVLHQDHGASPAVCQQAIRSGFTSVMMDGSLLPDQKTPAAYEYNVDVSRRVVEAAHAVGVSVEGELGCLGSLETGSAGDEDGVGAEGRLSRDELLTDPREAQIFVEATGVDALAIAIGTSHGAYKFSRQPTGDILAIERIVEIHERIPNTHLVMHGSSSVPQEWLAVIREYGGEIPTTYGVPVEEIQRGIAHGVRKVNIDTDIRLAMSGAMRKSMANARAEFDPRAALKAATAAASAICVERFEAFGCAGQASRIKPLPLEAMARRYH